ncbi:MAG: hypothetical protein ACI4W2_08410 [Eubacterium sp.]
MKVKKMLVPVLTALLIAAFMPVGSFAVSKPGKPTVTPLANTDSSIVVHWSKVKGANGYQIYRGGSRGGSYKKVKTINKQSTTVWNNTGLQKDHEYYYKVRAYKKYKGKNIYGKFSSPDYAKATSDPYYYENINIDEERSALSYIDCEFINCSTHNIVFKNNGGAVYLISVKDADADDPNTYEAVNIYSASNNDYYYPKEVVVEPGEAIMLSFETDEYYVDYDPRESVILCDADYYGNEYTITFDSLYAGLDPGPMLNEMKLNKIGLKNITTGKLHK